MRILKILLTAGLILWLVGCQKPESDNTVKVGTIDGPETKLMEIAKAVAAKKDGLDIVIEPFTDYLMPNIALSDGSIDANVYQHKPYLEAAMKSRHYKFAVLGKTFIYPMGLYSQQIKALKSLPDRALVAIPNDPSNEGRALLLLQQAGLITLKKDSGFDATPLDIENNPKQLQFKVMDGAQLPRVLADVQLAAINTNYAMVAGLSPSKDAIFIEDKNSPYANLIVVKEKDKHAAKLQKLVRALHSPEVVAETKKLFNNEAIVAWKQ